VDAQTNIITKVNDDIRITLIATDIDSDTVSFSIDSAPEHGTLSRPMTTAPHVAMAEYTPNPNYAGRDTFTFTVSDGSEDNGVSNTGRVTILVGSTANISDESVGDTNTAESSEPSSSPEGSGNQADTAENDEINDALNGGADINNNNRGPFSISTGNLPDIIPPTLIVPSQSIILDASTFIGASVNYESSANDNVDGQIALSCYPRSGLMFPIGESVVKCNATDKAGNTAVSSFAVIVKPFKFDSNSLLQLSIVVIIGAVGVAAAVLMLIRKRRHSFLNKDNYETTKLVLFNVYHLVKIACFRR
jgi:ABC-type antimicrobial peptide transport system permease subunit